ncbi:nucleic acid-binding OB-fold tRNA/helicase-type [cyanobacterium endosymbiont of Rhopalodia gibberula]|uniref:DNA-binding protein n=1 Tax=cyanobacterium endosymbiont of Rhopalodia gibberula TaxID=1763363 RepID=UPI000DC71FAC|nr:DNA-binding protein [cyanobacterium endosymbiont of Rhopalodia gibberula]BBA79427.1 nucleic acid-binding OB-fold tRNA/helicase-type [cyanobacterium endosymbiont of Rhopalodia gibberula]
MKDLNIRICHGGFLFLLLGEIIGCNRLNFFRIAQIPVTPINELIQYKQPKENPQTQEAVYYIEGTVVDHAPFMDNGSYKLQDDTGTVWVLTNGALPRPGDSITIKGQVEYQPISIGGQDLGELYILEVEQLETQPQTSDQPTQPLSSPQPESTSTPDLDVNELLLPHKSNSK